MLVPVQLCGEDANHRGDPIYFYYICNGLQDIKVKEGFSRDRAIQAGLHEGGPVLLQNSLGSTHVILAYARHTGEDRLQSQRKMRVEVGCQESASLEDLPASE